MAELVLTVDEDTPTNTMLEFATGGGSALIGQNAAAVTGYPSANRRFRSLEIVASIHTDLNGNYWWGLVSDPDSIEPVSGTTSPGASGTWSLASGSSQQWASTDLYGWRVPDFGAWETDYLTFTSSANGSNTVFATYDAGFDTYPIDVVARLRCADWDDASVDGNTIVNNGSGGQFDLRRTTTGIECLYRQSGAHTEECSWGTLGFTDGEWEWLRFTMDDTNGLRWWTGSPGSWSVVHTETKTAGTPDFAANWAPRIGNGLLVSSSGRGFGGDISDLQLYELGGSLTFDLNRDDIESTSDKSWDSLGPNPWTLTNPTDVTIVGAVRGTETIRFEPDRPMRIGDARIIAGPVGGGRMTIDTLTFDMGGYGWKVGSL